MSTADPSDLPAHSPLGASSSERWINCPGSTALGAMLASDDTGLTEEPDYRLDGAEAHRLAAECLIEDKETYQVDVKKYPRLTLDMMSAVREYVSYIRSLPGAKVFEKRVHHPDFHPAFYGTLDCRTLVLDTPRLKIIDYKHGAGVAIEPEHNTQTMYYAWGEIKEHPEWVDDMPVDLEIFQPRAWHPDGPHRRWTTTVGYIRKWAYEVLLPAMVRTETEKYLQPGEHCRFCPAKKICPAMRGLLNKLSVEMIGGRPVKQISNEELGELFQQWQLIKMMGKALEEEALARNMRGEKVAGTKLVARRTDRVWKAEAEDALGERFGEEAYEIRLRSPANVEKELPGGKEFVAEYAYKPPSAGFSVVLETDKRPAVRMRPSLKHFGV
jgi:hypothetical protein